MRSPLRRKRHENVRPADSVPRRGTVTDALREEAERGWAESDRKAAKGRRRTEARRAGAEGGTDTRGKGAESRPR
jgi:hypothetical protein